jgi:hypothetical protein
MSAHVLLRCLLGRTLAVFVAIFAVSALTASAQTFDGAENAESSGIDSPALIVKKTKAKKKWYYQHRVQVNCNAEICENPIKSIGKNKILEIHDFSCLARVDNGAEVFVMAVRANEGEKSRFDFAVPYRTKSIEDFQFFSAQRKTFFVVRPNEPLSVYAQSDGGDIQALFCTVTGEIIKY